MVGLREDVKRMDKQMVMERLSGISQENNSMAEIPFLAGEIERSRDGKSEDRAFIF